MPCQHDWHTHVKCNLPYKILKFDNCYFNSRYGQTGTGKTFTMEGEKSSEGGSWDKVSNFCIIIYNSILLCNNPPPPNFK